MNLLKQMKFFSVPQTAVINASGYSQSYVTQVLKGERYNEKIEIIAKTALRNRKEELLTELLKESA